jgi:hypothetical protein
MASLKELKTALKEEWHRTAGDLWKEAKALLWIVIPVVIASVISVNLWFMGGYGVVTWLVDGVIRAYHRNPQDVVTSVGFVLIVILLFRYAARRTSIVRGRQNIVRADPGGRATAIMTSLDEVRLKDPMPAEMKAVARKHGQRIAEYAIAKSSPGDSLEEIMERADEAVLAVPPLTLVGIARHEAAHILVAHALGAAAIKVEVYGVDHGGNARWAYPEMMSKPQNFCWIALVVAVAGNLVDQEEGRANIGSHNDLRSAEQDVYAIISTGAKPDGYDGDLAASALINAARDKAQSILAEHHDLYEKLAGELLQHRRLNSHQIRDIISSGSDQDSVPTS